MAPRASNKKSEKKIDNELLEKLKLDEEREKRKLEKEAKRREELDKITKECFARQASLLGNEKKLTAQPKKPVMKSKQNSKPKSSSNHKQHNSGLENRVGQINISVPSTSLPKSRSSDTKSYDPGNRFIQSNSHENAWKKQDSKSIQNRSRFSSVSDSMWNDSDEHFPALGAAAPVPTTNVWEERKSKKEAVKALEPQNEFDEEYMFQQAIALSMLEAEEEEKKRKQREEEYMKQMEVLQNCPELLEDFGASEEFVIAGNDLDSNIQLPDGLNNFQNKETSQPEFFSENTVSKFSEKEKAYSFRGARPKINNAIDRFGGWGLKDKKNNTSEKLSDFVNEIVSDKSPKKANDVTSDYHNSCKIKNAKENNSNLLGISDTIDVKQSAATPESWNDDKILYDEKGTFVDNDEDCNWDISSASKKENVNLPDISPNKVLDTWLSCDEVDDWSNDGILSKAKQFPTGIQSDRNFVCAPNYPRGKNEDLTEKIVPSFNSAYSSDITNSYDSDKNLNYQDLSTDISEKSVLSDKIDVIEQNELLHDKSDLYKYNINDQNDFSAFHESTQIPPIAANGTWSDKSEGSCFTSFHDKQSLLSKNCFDYKAESNKFINDAEGGVFDNATSNNDIDIPPILPPNPPPTALAMNEDKTFTTEVLDTNCKEETPSLPQPVPEIPVPQFPVMSNPVFNPMFPGFNPILGYGMDPILMRQMLIMSNPFLASQILAMEQHYRSLGMPVDLFSVPTPMPNVSVPRMMGPPLVPNTFANSVDTSTLPDTSQLQSHVNNNQFTVVSESNVTNYEHMPSEKPNQSVGLDTTVDFNGSSSLENDTDNPWYKSYLSSDSTSAIPPPKPPSHDVNCNNLVPIPEPFEASQNAFSFINSTVPNTYIPNDSIPQLPVAAERHESVSAIKACTTKTEITDWSDPEDDFIDTHKSKLGSWGDGWEDDSMPTKPLENPSLYEDKKKTVLRQPAKQPQISRYQRNRTYN